MPTQDDKRSTLSPEEAAECERLKREWIAFKAREAEAGRHWSQASFAAEFDWTQGNFGHYLNGRQPLNADALSRLSQRMGFSPDAVSPRLAAIINPPDDGMRELLLELPDDSGQATLDFFEFQLLRNRQGMPPEKFARYMRWVDAIKRDLADRKKSQQ